ncbi:hypothetical protein GTO27_00145 [Candidatus Bathyarchaeota archaeon]|nr:hypothetical protein [Candidatus Bathyarchaeota archaeon]
MIEEYTPKGTPYVLNEARRVLKPSGWFVAVEHWPLDSIKPVDKAQEAELRWWKIHVRIAQILGETLGVEYTAATLQRTLREAGFVVSHCRDVESTGIEPGIKFGPKITERAKRIPNKHLRETILAEMQCIEKDTLRHGMKELPHFVVYARNPKNKRIKRLKKLTLKEMCETVRRHDLLF